MQVNSILKGEKLYLRILEEADANEEYLQWMNDYEVVKYTESRFYPIDQHSLLSFIKRANDKNNITFAIVEKNNNKHIGNIKIGDIHWIHRFANIGLIIGDKGYWGRGFASEAVRLTVEYAFKRLNLRRLTAGIYIENIGSIKVFEKAGLTQSYLEKNKYYFEGRYMDAVTLELINELYC